MKKILTLLITILLLNFCLSADEDNCKTKDTDGKCTECNKGYTLKDGACVEDKDSGSGSQGGSGSGSQGGSGSDSQGGSGSGTGSSNSNTGSGSDDSSFSLYSSLLLGLLTILF